MDAALSPAPVVLPDPRLVTTVADLGEQLHRLRLAASRPAPTDNPLTLRELAVLTGLPHTTLGNAESGRVLPRVEVVYRVAKACGVPPEQLSWWTQARNRAAGQKRRKVHATAPLPRPSPADDGDALTVRGSSAADEEPVTPEQLLQELGGVGVERAAEQLSTRHPESVAVFLGQLHPGLVANVLATMDPVIATGHLSRLQPDHVAACLNEMSPMAVARLLALRPVADAAGYLSLMRPDNATAALLTMPTDALGQRLAHLNFDLARQIVHGMPAPQRMALLTGSPLPEAVFAEILFSVSLPETITFLATAPTTTAARALTVLSADLAAGLLNALHPPRAAKLLSAMPAEQATARLMQMTGEQAAVLLGLLPLRTVGAILAHLPLPTAARLLAWVPADRREPVLQHTRAERAVEIRWHTQRRSYQLWLRRLHAGVAQGEPPTLAEMAAPESPPPLNLTTPRD
ncbi:magnesium transporter MgtE N-terminal domain-containing protein [Paractinoplanes atraurantiacus]|uniref:MgtE intracellular N domain-containing protein n=1 Tax=Paractinoplanes atraurantiacus TaxID=1036182 RepID=A0A285KJN7_9ACTN|nr:helix-turn-helix domain-containing protein [Actinoplanes atraurantiacus]SNY72818.1 MgtE intracellular N domain-containing protein [Actinoplanes atraurantiacus]